MVRFYGFLIFLLPIYLFSFDIPDSYKTDLDSIEYKNDNINIEHKTSKSRKLYISTEKKLNITKLPYRKFKIDKNIKIVGNIVKIKDNDGKIKIVDKFKIIEENNKINSYIDQYIEALIEYKKDNNKPIDGCKDLFRYYKSGHNSCFTLFKLLNSREKKMLENYTRRFFEK